MDTAATALVQAAQTLLAEGDQAAAQARLREVVKFKSRAPQAHRMLGGLLLLDDDLHGTRYHWEQAFREWRDERNFKAAALVAADLADLHHTGFGNQAAGQG